MKPNIPFCLSGIFLGLSVTAFGQAPAPATTPAPPHPFATAAPTTLDLPTPAPAPAIAYVSDSGDMLVGNGGPNRTFAILKDSSDAKELPQIEEDLNVMAHILEKAASGRDDRSRNAMGIMIHSGMRGPGTAPRNLYLEGYGAVFFLNASFPLLEPGTKGKDDDAKENDNSEWEQARRELSQPGPHALIGDLPVVTPFGDGAAEEYDADRVEKLKSDLIASLKNAAHIRQLKPDETVTVVVTGRATGSDSRLVHARGGHGGRATVALYGAGNTETGARLILRVSQSDIEAYQKDKTSLEDFRKKVAVSLY